MFEIRINNPMHEIFLPEKREKFSIFCNNWELEGFEQKEKKTDRINLSARMELLHG